MDACGWIQLALFFGLLLGLTKPMGLVFHNFVSAAAGIAVAAALVRGIARQSTQTLGNFWVDLVRGNLYLLLPFCLFYALFLVSQGSIQNFHPYEPETTA